MAKVENPDLLLVPEVAALLRCSPSTVRRKANAGILPALRLGDSDRAPLRFARVELERWLFSSLGAPGDSGSVVATESPSRTGDA